MYTITARGETYMFDSRSEFLREVNRFISRGIEFSVSY